MKAPGRVLHVALIGFLVGGCSQSNESYSDYQSRVKDWSIRSEQRLDRLEAQATGVRYHLVPHRDHLYKVDTFSGHVWRLEKTSIIQTNLPGGPIEAEGWLALDLSLAEALSLGLKASKQRLP